jgi:hypothetical protein
MKRIAMISLILGLLSMAAAPVFSAPAPAAKFDAVLGHYEAVRQALLTDKMVGGKGTIVAFCSMTKKSWLQPKGEIGNPYYGKSMPRCGEVVSKCVEYDGGADDGRSRA